MKQLANNITSKFDKLEQALISGQATPEQLVRQIQKLRNRFGQYQSKAEGAVRESKKIKIKSRNQLEEKTKQLENE